MIAGRYVFLFLFLIAIPMTARGGEMCLTPSLAFAEAYNTNILLATDLDLIRKDYIATLSPGLELADRTERAEALLSLRLDRLRYARNEGLNDTNQLYSGSLRYAATERFRVSADAGYQEISNPSLIALPSQSTPPSPLSLVATPVQGVLASASSDYQLSETASITSAYRFNWHSYEIPRYRDRSHDVSAGLTVRLDRHLPRSTGRLNMDYTRIDLPNTRTINVATTVGISHDLSEAWSFLVNGGLRYTSWELFPDQELPSSGQSPSASGIVGKRTDWAGTGEFSLDYHGQQTGAGLSYIKDFAMTYLASGIQAPAERDTISLTARYQYSHELSASLTAVSSRYSIVHTLSQSSMTVTPAVRYAITRDLAVEASYERVRIDYVASGTADREMYLIRLSAGYPLCSPSR
jgi:hypothetical protein